MTTNPRDTQFAGFAESLFDDLLDIRGVYIDTMRDDWREEWKQLIAQRAYDLVRHGVSSLFEPEHVDEEVAAIPDLTTWPEEAK